MNADAARGFLTSGFGRKVGAWAVMRRRPCDAAGALLRHAGGILKLESTVLALALPPTSTGHGCILLGGSVGVKRAAGALVSPSELFSVRCPLMPLLSG